MENKNEAMGWEALKKFSDAYPITTFRPLAYYDKHLDCIRIQVKDCSFTEVRLNRFFTLWYENHIVKKKKVGFTIKGVKHLFVTLGLPRSGPIIVAQIIDGILRLYPEKKTQEVIGEIQKEFKDFLDLPVTELPEAA
jgi:hypothetical protein